MAIITNIRHFLDESGNVPDLPFETQELFNFLSAIIETATIAYGLPITLAEVHCRNMTHPKPCDGEIEVWVDSESNNIGWECLECAEEGVITHWEGTRWDKRDYTYH